MEQNPRILQVGKAPRGHQVQPSALQSSPLPHIPPQLVPTALKHTQGWGVPPSLGSRFHSLTTLSGQCLLFQGDTQSDTWIFVLAILLSSTIIYNSKGTIDQPAMEQLHYMAKLSDHVTLKAAHKKSKDEVEDSEKFLLFFPTFIWAVRDFTLQLELDGKEISEDDYLENALRLKDGKRTVLC
uniref:GB1/RHD3-type G domain-containing protein n=1 Tax=Otus sunia TaxID=257818 RepID=A0A8C8ARG4_9STRI